jgi:hypothetical protein
LTTDQWTLLSNLFHCYNEYQVLPFTQRLIDAHNAAKSTYMMYELLVDEFLVSVYETTGMYLRSNNDIHKLPSNDRFIILRNAADNLCCMGGGFILQHCLLYGLDAFLSAMNRRYGKRTMDIHNWARKFIDPDIIIIKLAISLFAFSENTGCYYSNISKDLTNPLNIFEIQNKYADVTWKYLLYKYGFYDAVKRFLNLTLWLASMNILAVHAQSVAVHLNYVDSVIEQTELTLILDEVDEITDSPDV